MSFDPPPSLSPTPPYSPSTPLPRPPCPPPRLSPFLTLSRDVGSHLSLSLTFFSISGVKSFPVFLSKPQNRNASSARNLKCFPDSGWDRSLESFNFARVIPLSKKLPICSLLPVLLSKCVCWILGKNTHFLAKCTFSAGKQFLRKVDFGQMAPNSAEVRGGTIQKLCICKSWQASVERTNNKGSGDSSVVRAPDS